MDYSKFFLLMCVCISCASSKQINQNCEFDELKYSILNDTSSNYKMGTVVFHQFYLIENWKGSNVVQHYVMQFFNYSNEEFDLLNFDSSGTWCQKKLPAYKFTTKKNYDVSFISYPILNKDKDRAFIISSMDSFVVIQMFELKDNGFWKFHSSYPLSM